MEEQLISFDTAKLAKEKGLKLPEYIYRTQIHVFMFNEDKPHTFHSTRKSIDDKHLYRPTQSLLQKWLREKHFFNIIVFNDEGDFGSWSLRYNYQVRTILNDGEHSIVPEGSEAILGTYNYDSYEEALEKGLQRALKLI